MSVTVRPQVSDLYQSHRFMVYDDFGGGSFISTPAASAGFSSCTMPEANIEHVEYSEGGWTYSRVFPGRTTFTTVTLSRGVVVRDSAFYEWAKGCSEGKNYRTNITIVQLHRADVEGMAPQFNLQRVGQSRKIKCFNCMPIRFRPGHDFDALTSDVSIQEVEFQPEYFTIEVTDPKVG